MTSTKRKSTKEKTIPSSVDNGRYDVLEQIGCGTFGIIHKGFDTETKEVIAIKFESSDARSPQLSHEAKIYQIVEFEGFFPRVRYIGNEGAYYCLVMDMMGKSLCDLISEYGKFSLKTTLAIAYKMLCCVEALHHHGYLHRDMKPENFVMGINENSSNVYLIDFGLTDKYLDFSTQAHIPYTQNNHFVGTMRYSSINTMEGINQSRRDDLEALFYIWVFMLKGKLPWMNLGGDNHKQRLQRILEVKKKTDKYKFLNDIPKEMSRIYYSIRQLRFTDEPNYKVIKGLLGSAFKRIDTSIGIENCNVYDWSEKYPMFDSSSVIYKGHFHLDDDIDMKNIHFADESSNKGHNEQDKQYNDDNYNTKKINSNKKRERSTQNIKTYNCYQSGGSGQENTYQNEYGGNVSCISGGSAKQDVSSHKMPKTIQDTSPVMKNQVCNVSPPCKSGDMAYVKRNDAVKISPNMDIKRKA